MSFNLKRHIKDILHGYDIPEDNPAYGLILEESCQAWDGGVFEDIADLNRFIERAVNNLPL